MFRTFSKSLGVVSTAILVVAVPLAWPPGLPSGLNATALAAQGEAEKDTVVVDGAAKKNKDGHVSIKIDEHGIRIEGADGAVDTTDSERRIIFDSGSYSVGGTSRRYEEKGTDIVKFGEDIHVEAAELVRGDIVVFGGEVIVEGKVVGNVVVLAGNASVRTGAEINGDVVVLGGTLEEESGVVIHGERVMLADLNLPYGGVSHFFGNQVRFFEFFFIPIQFFISIILSFLIVLFLKDRVVASQQHVQESFLKSFGVGSLAAFVGACVVLVLFGILCITIIGIPLALVLIASWLGVGLISFTVFIFALGSAVNEKLNIQTDNPFAIVLVGTAVIFLPALMGYGISLWPLGGGMGALFKIFGCLFGIFAYVVGFGALFISRFGGRTVTRETLPT